MEGVPVHIVMVGVDSGDGQVQDTSYPLAFCDSHADESQNPKFS